jgi:hypothetical protein
MAAATLSGLIVARIHRLKALPTVQCHAWPTPAKEFMAA